MKETYIRFILEPVLWEKDILAVMDCLKRGKVIYAMLDEAGLKNRVVSKGLPLMREVFPTKEDRLKAITGTMNITPSRFNIDDLYVAAEINTLLEAEMVNSIYTAPFAGIFILLRGKIEFLPVDFNGFIDFSVGHDKMSVELDYFPSGPGGESLSMESIITHLNEIGIKGGLELETIREAIDKTNREGKPLYDVLSAKGVLPQHGKDGSIEFLIDLSRQIEPSLTEDGRIDFYNLNIIHTIAKNQPIYRINRPEKGIDGFDVFGKVIKALDGKMPPRPIVTNAKPSEEDPDVYVSKINGTISLQRGEIIISDLFVVSGDVDFSIGNITIDSSIHIRGTVHSNFKINVGNNIRIDGGVEDALITSGRDIFVARGFIGSGRGMIRSSGTARIGFVENQTVVARNAVYITGEWLNAHIKAGKAIYAGINRIPVIGGDLSAGDLIEIGNLGNEYGSVSHISAGVNIFLQEEIEELLQTIRQLEEELAEIIGNLKKYLSVVEFEPALKIGVQKMIEKRDHIQLEIETSKNRVEELRQRMTYNPDAKVKILGHAYPGSRITINRRTFTIQEHLFNKSISLSKIGEFLFS